MRSNGAPAHRIGVGIGLGGCVALTARGRIGVRRGSSVGGDAEEEERADDGEEVHLV